MAHDAIELEEKGQLGEKAGNDSKDETGVHLLRVKWLSFNRFIKTRNILLLT